MRDIFANIRKSGEWPLWIGEIVWFQLNTAWGSIEYSKRRDQNQHNKASNVGGMDSSLHTRGLVPYTEHKRCLFDLLLHRLHSFKAVQLHPFIVVQLAHSSRFNFAPSNPFDFAPSKRFDLLLRLCSTYSFVSVRLTPSSLFDFAPSTLFHQSKQPMHKIRNIIWSRYDTPYISWKKVPKEVRNMWFREFEKEVLGRELTLVELHSHTHKRSTHGFERVRLQRVKVLLVDQHLVASGMRNAAR
ncbi:hypothetical protein KFK09_002601 [Dendrobium nobile]|uniref:Uncharacterized protein n=1 Tax=Dendrobium nobile TaxID=94219 RepID=A0A8T3C5C9_DENNO|nr:hypothetical protein KFK09_002601 [Dendrobium nobile]